MSDAKVSLRMPSRRLGHDVLVCRWGHVGVPVLLFPTAGGDAEEVERFHMIEALSDLLAAGRIMVYGCDSVGGQALTRHRELPRGAFGRIQSRFDEFVAHEMVPWIREDCRSPDIGIVTAGASIGAFNAVAAVCRHPDLFVKAVAMSGTYDLTKWLDPADVTEDFYFSSPIHFLPRLGPSEQLTLLQKRLILMPTGQGAYEDPSESWRMAHVLGAKGVPNRVDPWGTEWRHDWVTWRAMLPKYLSEL